MGRVPLQIYPTLLVCEHCDTVCQRRPLSRGQFARCERCAAVLYRSERQDVDHWLALTITAAIAFVIANVCPVVSVDLQGLHNQATLWQSMAALAHGTAAPIALPAALAVIVVPFLQISMLSWVLLFARSGKRAPGFVPLIRVLVALRPWSMVEVCLLGILVAIIKLSSYLHVVADAGMWASAVLTVLITMIASRDLEWLWPLTEPQRGAKVEAQSERTSQA